MQDIIKMIVVNENILAYIVPEKPHVGMILAVNILKGGHDSGSLFLYGRDVRMATPKDFNFFRVCSKGYENDSSYLLGKDGEKEVLTFERPKKMEWITTDNNYPNSNNLLKQINGANFVQPVNSKKINPIERIKKTDDNKYSFDELCECITSGLKLNLIAEAIFSIEIGQNQNDYAFYLDGCKNNLTFKYCKKN